MTALPDSDAKDEVARVAYAIWESEGRPEGRDVEHWMQAKRQVEEGDATLQFPAAKGDEIKPGAVQFGSEDVVPLAGIERRGISEGSRWPIRARGT